MQLEVQTAEKDKSELQTRLRTHKATLARHKGDIVRTSSPSIPRLA